MRRFDNEQQAHILRPTEELLQLEEVLKEELIALRQERQMAGDVRIRLEDAREKQINENKALDLDFYKKLEEVPAEQKARLLQDYTRQVEIIKQQHLHEMRPLRRALDAAEQLVTTREAAVHALKERIFK